MRDVGDIRQDYEELDSTISSGLRVLAVRDDSVLADKISRLIIWYSLQKRDLSDEDKNHLDSSLVECYRRYGITFDNDSVLEEDGAFRKMPIIADWYNVLQENTETKHLAVVLARYVTGSVSAMGARNDIDLDGGKYGKGILDSSRIKLVMQMEEQEARLIQGVLNLSKDEVRQITRFRRGEGLLCIGYNHVPIAFHATQKEYDAITTSPTDLQNRRCRMNELKQDVSRIQALTAGAFQQTGVLAALADSGQADARKLQRLCEKHSPGTGSYGNWPAASLVLLSQKSELNVCHITLLDQADAADFFAMHSGDYIRSDFYSGIWSC